MVGWVGRWVGKNINFLAPNLLCGPTLTSVHDYQKTIALTIWTFVGKVMFLLFNTLSRLVIAFFSNKRMSFNFMCLFMLEIRFFSSLCSLSPQLSLTCPIQHLNQKLSPCHLLRDNLNSNCFLCCPDFWC